MIITWDEPKRLTTLRERGLDFADLTEDFFVAAQLEPAKHGRTMAIGWFQGRVVVAVVYRPLGTEAVSVISMRHASRKERRKFNDR